MGWWLLTEKERFFNWQRKSHQTGNCTGLLLLWKLSTDKSRNLLFVVSNNNVGNSWNFRFAVVIRLLKPEFKFPAKIEGLFSKYRTSYMIPTLCYMTKHGLSKDLLPLLFVHVVIEWLISKNVGDIIWGNYNAIFFFFWEKKVVSKLMCWH